MSRCDYCKKYNDCKDSGFVPGPCGAYLPAREYVIVCNEHKAILPEALLFWGKLSEDDQERSFGGYTCDISKCERYTKQELEKWRGDLKEEYPFLDEIDRRTFYKHEEVFVTIEQLISLGFRQYTIMAKP